jgi:predicted restriction endonuclease
MPLSREQKTLYQRVWVQKNLDKVRKIARESSKLRRLDPLVLNQQRAYQRSRYAENPDHSKMIAKRCREKLRTEVLAHYGHRCACCGETENRFLSIDHINNDGAEHRRQSKLQAGNPMYRWLKKNNFPQDFQLLCHNCNMAKGFYGQCPHEESRLPV